jgi:hypothetical protein
MRMTPAVRRVTLGSFGGPFDHAIDATLGEITAFPATE